MMKLQIC